MNFRITILCVTLSLFYWNEGNAQPDSLIVNNDFDFKDGIYLSFESFQKNQPDYLWEDIRLRMHLNDESLIATINQMELLDSAQVIPLQKVWGLSFEGVPYINFDTSNVDYVRLAAFRQVGKVCYYSYWTTETEMVSIKAYNPVTGRPFRQAKLPKEKQVLKEWILNFETGAVWPFNKPNLLPWIKEDPTLYEAVKKIDKASPTDTLFNHLKLFNQRNTVFIVK